MGDRERMVEDGVPRPTKTWRYWIFHPREWRQYRRLKRNVERLRRQGIR